MIIKLYQPPTRGWLLIAEQLDDPQGWDRFLPNHTASSQRWHFEHIAKQTAGGVVTITPCKDLLRRGSCIFEYDWQVDEADILSHAIQVAELLGLELMMEAPVAAVNAGRTAA
jgi:hypothetical protein